MQIISVKNNYLTQTIIIIIIISSNFALYTRFLKTLHRVFTQNLAWEKVAVICILCMFFAASFEWYFLYFSSGDEQFFFFFFFLAKWIECSPMVQETWVQSQVASYQRL